MTAVCSLKDSKSHLNSLPFFCLMISVFNQPLQNFFSLITLNKDFTIFCRAPGSAEIFEFFNNVFLFAGISCKTFNKRYHLSCPVFGLYPDR